MNAIDFSDYERSDKFYGGSEKKIGITVDGHDYMIKFQKEITIYQNILALIFLMPLGFQHRKHI